MLDEKNQELVKLRAVSHGSLAEVKLLLLEGMRPDQAFKYFDKVTPLHCAINNKNIAILLYLLDESMRLGVDIDMKSEDGLTPLLKAGRVGKLNYVNALIEYGADPEVSDSSGMNLIELMEDNDLDELVPEVNAQIKTHSRPKQPLL